MPVGHPNFGKAVRCSCQAQSSKGVRLERLQRYSNLGALARLSFAGLSPQGRSNDPELRRRFTEAFQATSEYADDPGGWLLLTGPVGSGKTHLLAAIVNRCLEREVPAFYISVPDLLDHLRASFAPASEVSYDQLFDHVRNTPVLALDDLGAHATTPWAQEKLYQVLNHRFNRQLSTVIALTVPLSQLDDQLRVRLEDRTAVQRIAVGEQTLASSHLRLDMDKIKAEMKRRMTFDTFDIQGNRADATGQETLKLALKSAQVFAQEPSGWLVFTGGPGCGKTHLAVSIVERWERREGHLALFAPVPDLLDHLRFTFSPQSSVTYDQFFEEVRTSPLLVLDDLGAHSSTPWAEEKLYQIVVYRQEARLPTVITVRGYVRDLPEAVRSRLGDATLVTEVPITAPDYRNRGAARAETPRAPADQSRPRGRRP